MQKKIYKTIDAQKSNQTNNETYTKQRILKYETYTDERWTTKVRESEAFWVHFKLFIIIKSNLNLLKR